LKGEICISEKEQDSLSAKKKRKGGSTMKKFVVLCLMFFLTSCGGGNNPPPPGPTPSSAKAITAFSLNGAAGTINETGKTIAVTMPFGTDVTSLVATFTTTGASVKVGSTVQTSGTTANSFTNPVTYTVTAVNASTQDYTVTVMVSSNPSILLSDDFTGTIVDASNWHIPTWVSPTDGTFVGQTQFRCSQNAPLPAASNSNAIITLDTYNPTGLSFYGTDLISNQSFTLAQGIIITVIAKMDAPIPAGIVGGIFLYAPPASTSNTLHDEIDFELLSSDPYYVHTNIYGNELLGTGHPASYPYATGSVTDYHTYQIEWLPDQVSWYVDGKLIRTVTTQSPIPAGPLYVHFNMWVPGSDFAAAYNPSLYWTSSASANQTFSMSVDSVTVSR
jgi:hypothetical protein